jgi:hypothetical protein
MVAAIIRCLWKVSCMIVRSLARETANGAPTAVGVSMKLFCTLSTKEGSILTAPLGDFRSFLSLLDVVGLVL